MHYGNKFTFHDLRESDAVEAQCRQDAKLNCPAHLNPKVAPYAICRAGGLIYVWEWAANDENLYPEVA